MEGEIEPKTVEVFLQRKADCQEEIEHLQKELETLKAARKETARHIAIDELPEDEKFQKLSTPSKHLFDTIEMIAYRAETAMANQCSDTAIEELCEELNATETKFPGTDLRLVLKQGAK